MLLDEIKTIAKDQWVFRWYTNWESISAPEFQKKWHSMLAASHFSSPFFHPKVVDAWIQTYGGKSMVDPFYLVANKDNGSCVFFPFVSINTGWKQGFIKRIHPVGQVVFDYQDPIVVSETKDDVDVLDSSFWNMLNVELDQHGSDWYDSFSVPRIRKYLLPNLAKDWKDIDRAPYAELAEYDNFEHYFKCRKKSLRTDVRRQIKRTKEIGTIEFKVYQQDEIDDVLKWIPALEKSRKERYPTSTIPPNLLCNLVKSGMADKVVNCSCLSINDVQVSWHLGFLINNTLHWYIPIYNMEYAHLSPGKVHLYYMLEWAYENNIKVFDFLRGGETYKAGWTDGSEYLMVSLEKENQVVKSKFRKLMSKQLNKLGYLRGWFR